MYVAKTKNVIESVLSPIIALTIGKGLQKRTLNFLIDTGSQITIINHQMAKELMLTSSRSNRNFSCFQSDFKLDCYNATLPIESLNGGKSSKLKVVSVPDFNINYHLPKLNSFVASLQSKHKISPNFLESVQSMRNHKLIVHGILGIDNLGKLLSFQTKKINEQDFLEIDMGLIPIGNVQQPASVFAIQVNKPIKSCASNNIKINFNKCPKNFTSGSSVCNRTSFSVKK